jgi:outer membrane protein assembly factor BamB
MKPTANLPPPSYRNLALTILLLIAAGTTFGQANSSAPDPIEGKWYGVTGFPTDRVELGFEFKRNERQELKAYLYAPVVNFYGLELPGLVKREGRSYVNDAYRLSVTLTDGVLEGTYFPLKAPILLTRTDKLPVEVPLPELPKGPGPKWQVKLGSGIYAPVAVRDGNVYVGTSGGLFHNLSLKDGSFVWTFAAGRAIHGEALVTETQVYFVCDNGFLFNLERKTGKEVWRYDLDDSRVSRFLPHQVVDNSGDFDWDDHSPRPLLIDSVIYVGSGDGSMHAVDAATGKRVWRFAGKGKIRTDAVADGPRVLFGTFDNILYAIDRQTGNKVWEKDTLGPITNSPSMVDGRLIVGNRNGLLAALNPLTGQVFWRMLFWGSAIESSAVASDAGLFYIGASDLRRVSLIDAKDGRVVWRTDVYGWPWAKPALSEKVVYVSVAGGTPYQMRHVGSLTALDRKNGKILWRWPMPEWPGSFLNGFTAAPVVADGIVVVGGLDGTLYGFGVE